jgi:hypothetical protein
MEVVRKTYPSFYFSCAAILGVVTAPVDSVVIPVVRCLAPRALALCVVTVFLFCVLLFTNAISDCTGFVMAFPFSFSFESGTIRSIVPMAK